ncbi:DUF3892 domain-containing protein [Clostridium sp. WILCCON 0269]|uniref:DUF3892 domain-containing protein n=1 Tax=Candidatus Clostridium eludens TaxID=3381663 RepID=A0ABW8SPL9_9CLOT
MEYGIFKVEYEDYNCNKGDAHITKVRAYEIMGEGKFSNNYEEHLIEDVIQNIKNGHKYVTLISDDDDKLRKGAEIILKEFITTKPDTNRGSDLGSLPLIPYDIWEL